MPKIIEVGDQNCLVNTDKFPFLKFPFEQFNPVQSRVFDFYNQPVNLVIAARTAAGKTACCEMVFAHERFVQGGKGMYVGPLKALSQEKVDDWGDQSHGFS